MNNLHTFSMPISIHASFLLRLTARVLRLSLGPRERIRTRRLHIRSTIGVPDFSSPFNPRDILSLILQRLFILIIADKLQPYFAVCSERPRLALAYFDALAEFPCDEG
jgi:hypothetical protein